VMTSLELVGKIPFHRVFVHPTILNWEGRRMSKSLGTGVDPMDLIRSYGADATRFGLIVQCATGQDVRFTEERIEMSRNFANKIWNAARLVRMSLDEDAYERARGAWPDAQRLASAGSVADRWILGRLEATTAAVTDALAGYRVDEAARSLYDFFWGELCDWYLEIAKSGLRGDDADARAHTQDMLIYTFERTLRLLHPFMPFITEELWQALPHQGESVMIAPWPRADADVRNQEAEMSMSLVMQVVTSARRLRAEQGVEPGATVDLALTPEGERAGKVLSGGSAIIAHLARAGSVSIGDAPPQVVADVIAWEGEQVRVGVSAAPSAEDLRKERQRLDKELAEVDNEAARMRARLDNENFLARAPEAVVAGTRARIEDAERRARSLRERIAALEAKLSG